MKRPICPYSNNILPPFFPLPQLHPHSPQVALLTSPHSNPQHLHTSQQTPQQRLLTNQHRTQHTQYSPQACLHGLQRLLLLTYLRYVRPSVRTSVRPSNPIASINTFFSRNLSCLLEPFYFLHCLYSTLSCFPIDMNENESGNEASSCVHYFILSVLLPVSLPFPSIPHHPCLTSFPLPFLSFSFFAIPGFLLHRSSSQLF